MVNAADPGESQGDGFDPCSATPKSSRSPKVYNVSLRGSAPSVCVASLCHGQSAEVIVKIVNIRFWRLEPGHWTDPVCIPASNVLTSPAELTVKVRPLDGIVLGDWDPDTEQGKIHALGIVREVNKGHSVVVDWRRANFSVRPSGPGGTQWRTRPFFRFADLVADRYGLMDYFQDAFTEKGADTANLQLPVHSASSPVATVRKSHSPDQLPGIIPVAEPHVPQCNRVSPSSDVFATRERGMFMGNRTSPPRWLVCDLHFKRDLKEPRKYTKLFFLDEAVALAAGHRPCNTCRRDRYQAYVTAVKTDIDVAGAAELDALLNAARSAAPICSAIASLPDGAYVAFGEGDYRLKWSGALHRWTPAGYVDPVALIDLQVTEAIGLTPEPSVAALRNGYAATVHLSASKR